MEGDERGLGHHRHRQHGRQKITFNGGKNSILSNVISGSGSITQSGVGTLTLSGSNTYSGATSLSAGTLIIGSNTALGTGNLTITAGTLATNGTARTLTNTNAVNGSFTFNSPADLTLSGSTSLGANVTITVSGGGALTFGGIVSGGTRILTKAGTGTLVLNVANTYSGGTVVNAGSLVIGNAQALGTGTASFGTATVSATGSAKFITNAVQLTGNTTFGGTTDMTFNTGTTLTGSRTVTVNSANVILNGIVSGTGFALSKSGAGTLTLGGTSSNTFSGGANVNDGVLLFSKSANINAFSGALLIGDGSGASRSAIARLNQINQIPDASGVTLNGDGMLDLQTYTDTVASITANGGVITGTGTGRLDLGGNITVNGTGSLMTLIEAALGLNGSRTFLVNDNSVLGDADLTIAGLISNGSAASGITKSGLGTLLLSGANTFSGGTTLLNGTVLMDSSSTGSITSGPLGTSTVLLGDTTGSNSAALLFATTSGCSISNPITVRAGSSGTRTIGAMNTSGVSTYSSAITLNASALLSAALGGRVDFTGVLSGVGGITKTGAGSVYFTNTNTLSGALVVQSGVLNLSGANGKLSAVPSITINAGATLILDNTAGENFTRIPAGAPVTLNGGELKFLSSTNNSSQQAGTLNASGGTSTLTVVHNGTPVQSTSLTFSSLGTIAPGASVNFAGTGGTLGSGLFGPHIFITGQANGILGSWARVGSDFAEYSTDGIRAFSTYYTGGDGINVNDSSKAVLLDSLSPSSAYTLTNAGTTTDGSLKVTDIALVYLGSDPTRTLNLFNSGLIKTSAVNTLISGSGRLTAGGTATATLNISVEATRTLTISAPIINNAGTNGIYGDAGDGVVSLLKADPGLLVLSAANTFSGDSYLAGGTLSIVADASLGATTNSVQLAGGTLQVTSSFATAAGRRLLITAASSGTLKIGAGLSLTIGGASDRLATSDSGGILNKTDAGDLILGGSNPNFTGSLNISGGNVELQNATSLGSNTSISLDGGSLRLRSDSSATFVNHITATADATISAPRLTGTSPAVTLTLGNITIGSQTLSLSATNGADLALGAVTLTDAPTFNTSAGSTTVGAISGSFGFTKTGGGTLAINGASSYSGSTLVQNGTLTLGNAAGVSGTSALTVQAGATFDLRNLNALIGSLIGAGDVTLGSGTLDAGGNGGTTTFTGTISGSGGFTKSGTGTMTLGHANSYTGATAINNGTLLTSIADALPSLTALTLDASGTLDLSGVNQTVGSVAGAGNILLGGATLSFGGNGISTSYAGTITGTGNITKNGAGTFTVSGGSDYIGQTTVSGGTLQLGAANALPATTAVSLANGTTFDLAGFTQTIGSLQGAGALSLGAATFTTGTNDSDVAFSGAITGSGNITKTGNGAQTLSGTNTFSGGVTILGGALSVDNESRLGTSTTINLNGGTLAANTDLTLTKNLSLGVDGGTLDTATSNVTFSGTLSGTATTLSKAGTGTLTITTTDAAFSSELSIDEGRVLVNGALTSMPATVNDGGTLGGTGTVGVTNVLDGGTLAPGAGIGRINTAALTMSVGSALSIELGGTVAGTSYDQVSTTGALTLGGVPSVTLANGFFPVVGNRFFVMLNDANDNISGTFDLLAEGSTFTADGITYAVSYVANGDGGPKGNDVSFTVTVVPEPAAALQLLVGLSLVMSSGRRRSSTKRAA